MRGLSGGERKRVNIGVELLNDPPLVFMDEPTSGLDSFQAEAVMQTLSNLSRAGRTVVASIHQPRSSIYAMLDQILLIASGRLAYFGPAGGEVESYFDALGLPVPASFNPADHLIDIVSFDGRDEVTAPPTARRPAHDEKAVTQTPPCLAHAARHAPPHEQLSPAPPQAVAKATEARVATILDAWAQHALPSAAASDATAAELAAGGDEPPLSWATGVGRGLTAFRLLAQRTLQDQTRDSTALAFKYTM